MHEHGSSGGLGGDGRGHKLDTDRHGGDGIREFGCIFRLRVGGCCANPGIRTQNRSGCVADRRIAEAVGGDRGRADQRLPLAVTRNVGHGVGEELNEERGIRQAIQRALDRADRTAADGGLKDRIVLQIIGAGAKARRVRRNPARRVAIGNQVDTDPAVGENAVGQDAVAGSRLDQNAVPDVEGDDVALARDRGVGALDRDRPANRVVAGTVADDDAVDLVAQPRSSADVRADVVALDRVVRGTRAVELNAPVVGRD